MSASYITFHTVTFSNLTLHYSHYSYEYKKRSVVKN